MTGRRIDEMTTEEHIKATARYVEEARTDRLRTRHLMDLAQIHATLAVARTAVPVTPVTSSP